VRIKDNPHFAIRIPREKLDKIKYIAEYNARSANREIEVLITNHIRRFEKENGAIVLNERFSENQKV
jgi:hypothetical protein